MNPEKVNRVKYIQVFFILFSCIAATAQKTPAGTEYHVALKGNDANSGTAARPLKTIMAAAARAMPGDIITVHTGVYREQIIPPRGGNSEQERIVYRAAEGAEVVIKGSEIIKNWKHLHADTWEVRIPNSFFGKMNPYKEQIRGDWFWPTPKGRTYHRGAVYLNGSWLMEAEGKEEVLQPAGTKDALWWAATDSTATIIRAQFKGVNPNQELVEINVRPVVFYPNKPFINYITVRGFTMEQAATNWAPPTAEQQGLIGTHWSRGWIIENNKIQYSKCVGISLGKYGDGYDNNQTESAEGYVGTINRALAFGWNKATVGGHLVRNNTVAYCEQAGIVGSMGCAFSKIEHNVIHDIHIKRLFTGAEMAGIKFHGAVDVEITGNRIYRTNMGVWLDWMAQGAQVKKNLFYENDIDIFLEVDHGPMLVSNNIMLSKKNLLMNSSGAAFVHNLFSGNMEVVAYDSRLTPYHLPHSTFVKALHDNPGGDIQFVNNLFVKGANTLQYSSTLLPVLFDGNVYTKGAVRISGIQGANRLGEMTAQGKEHMKKYQEQAATEQNAVIDTSFDAGVTLTNRGAQGFLELVWNKQWLLQTRKEVTTRSLKKAVVPDLPFENPDGTFLKVDTDYKGSKRPSGNPAPGPFEISGNGRQMIRLY